MSTRVESPGEERLTPRHKIQTEPLTQILDEIDDSIRLANEAAKNARDAAEEARRAGEKAANEAARLPQKPSPGSMRLPRRPCNWQSW
jgi:hypothetical protein